MYWEEEVRVVVEVVEGDVWITLCMVELLIDDMLRLNYSSSVLL